MVSHQDSLYLFDSHSRASNSALPTFLFGGSSFTSISSSPCMLLFALHSASHIIPQTTNIRMGSTNGQDGLVVLDGLDEANGQAVRIAITLSAITLKPVRIQNIRRSANQPGEFFPHGSHHQDSNAHIPLSHCLPIYGTSHPMTATAHAHHLKVCRYSMACRTYPRTYLAIHYREQQTSDSDSHHTPFLRNLETLPRCLWIYLRDGAKHQCSLPTAHLPILDMQT